MGIEIQSWAWRQAINPATKLVFVKLAESANDETGECWPSLRHLSLRCGMAQNTIRFHLRKLKEAGLLSVKADFDSLGRQTSNIYKILAPGYQEVDIPPPMDGRGTLQPIGGLEPELEPKKDSSAEESIHMCLGEFGCTKLTGVQLEKLKHLLNGKLDGYVDRFDRWVHEAPNAKHSGVKRKDRHAYESILNWFDRDKGTTPNGHQRESIGEQRNRQRQEQEARILSKGHTDTRKRLLEGLK